MTAPIHIHLWQVVEHVRAGMHGAARDRFRVYARCERCGQDERFEGTQAEMEVVAREIASTRGLPRRRVEEKDGVRLDFTFVDRISPYLAEASKAAQAQAAALLLLSPTLASVAAYARQAEEDEARKKLLVETLARSVDTKFLLGPEASSIIVDDVVAEPDPSPFPTVTWTLSFRPFADPAVPLSGHTLDAAIEAAHDEALDEDFDRSEPTPAEIEENRRYLFGDPDAPPQLLGTMLATDEGEAEVDLLSDGVPTLITADADGFTINRGGVVTSVLGVGFRPKAVAILPSAEPMTELDGSDAYMIDLSTSSPTPTAVRITGLAPKPKLAPLGTRAKRKIERPR
jgi:hypothetical protein